MSFLNKIGFNSMALAFKIRDLLIPPESVVKETGIKGGQIILDYGCGPGSYSIAAAKLVGNRGKVFAADISNDAINYIRKVVLV